MYYKIIKNDFLKSKLITLITIVFIVAAAMLISLAAILIVNLSGSIETLMTTAKTPHFLQMHSGTINVKRLTRFAHQNSNVEAFQILEFLNVDSSDIIIGEDSLADNVQDNGFCIQSKTFDYLLDLNGEVIHPQEGELYVPLCYRKDGLAKIGDKALIGGKALIVAGFLRDSQMNSLQASSKRFLVSEEDFKELKAVGKSEYLVEFRLKDLERLGEFEKAYTMAKLEANGPTIIYPLFKMINALSDGLMIAVILLVSVLVVAVSLMCIRFTLLAKIEEDYEEIGVMKAIGLRISEIKKIYLAKYAALGGVGCILGFVLSLFFRRALLENIRLSMGESQKGYLAPLFGGMSVVLVALAIIVYVNGVLRRFKKISPAEAIRFGMAQEKTKGTKHFCLSSNRFLSINVFLGIQDVLSHKKLYRTMLVVIMISAFIMIVPKNMYHTLSSKSFITFMGTGSCDMRIDIQQTDNISEKVNEVVKVMASDSTISKYVVLTTKAFTVKIEDGTEERLKIEFGNQSVFPINYAKGRAPIVEEEIALSSIQADELGKKVGEVITLIIDGKEKQLNVCGIYSDITNGGKTAKAVFKDTSTDIMWSIICVEFSDNSIVASKILDYKNQLRFAKVSSVDDYITQTMGSTIEAVGKASSVSILVALMISGLVTLLFMKMLVIKDRYETAVMKAFGLTSKDIETQYMTRSMIVMIIGIVLGMLLANTLGGVLAGAVIATFGATSFRFVVDPVSAYLLCPLMMIGTILIATIIGTSDVKNTKISENIKE